MLNVLLNDNAYIQEIRNLFFFSFCVPVFTYWNNIISSILVGKNKFTSSSHYSETHRYIPSYCLLHRPRVSKTTPIPCKFPFHKEKYRKISSPSLLLFYERASKTRYKIVIQIRKPSTLCDFVTNRRLSLHYVVF